MGLEGWKDTGCWGPLDYPCRQAFDVTGCHTPYLWRPQTRAFLSLWLCTVTSPPANQQSCNKTTSLCNTHQQSASSTQKHRQGQPPASMKLPSHLGCSSYEAWPHTEMNRAQRTASTTNPQELQQLAHVKVHSIQTISQQLAMMISI